jgi:hypothetical protein
MKPSRSKIAAAVTVGALGALGTVALASGDTQKNTLSAAPAAAVTQPAAEVRTEIIRETVHRRAKRSDASGSSGRSGGSSGRSGGSPGPSRSAAAPATTAVAPAPVSTPDQHRGRGRDDEGSDDHGGRDDEGADDHGDDVEVEHHGGGDGGHG